MSAKRYHLCLDLRGALLNWNDRQMRAAITHDDGRPMTSKEARLALMDEIAKGRKVNDALRQYAAPLEQEIIRLRESNVDLIARHAEDTQRAVAAERERCAKIAEWTQRHDASLTWNGACAAIAAKIREVPK